MGAAGPVSMLCCTRAVLLQSSRAAKLSKKSLNRCRSCSAACLDAHHCMEGYILDMFIS